MENIQDKTVIITGGARGIGYSIVEELLRKGAKVVYNHKKEKNKHNIYFITLRFYYRILLNYHYQSRVLL